MPAKRAASSPRASPVKKARISADPVQKKIQVVIKALTDDSISIPGPASCREMLIAIAPVALETTSEERHDNQNKVIAMLQEAFEAERAKQQAVVDEQQKVVDVATGDRAGKVAIKEEAEAKLKAHKAQTEVKKQALCKAEEVVDESTDYLKRFNEGLAISMKQHEDTLEEQNHVSEMQEAFKSLKEGTCENPKDAKKHCATIISLLKSLEVEEGLIKSLPQALGQKPADRGNFDHLTIEQVETTLDRHIACIKEKVTAEENMIHEQEVAILASEAAKELATEKQLACQKVIEEADVQQDGLMAEIVAARSVVKEHTTAVRQRNNILGEMQLRLTMFCDVQGAISFLESRTAPQPAEEPVVEAAIENDDAMSLKVPSPARGNAPPAS